MVMGLREAFVSLEVARLALENANAALAVSREVLVCQIANDLPRDEVRRLVGED